jgi:tRNA dimethylallyltransferase
VRKVVIIAGPTCCGKTNYSIEYIKNCDAKIINGDSLQVYRDLKILTAFPVEYELHDIEHQLFGFLESSEKITAYDWAILAAHEIDDAFKENKIPVIVGGTGFFINTLINGVSMMPVISPEIRHNSKILAKNNYDTLCQYVYGHDRRLKEVIPKSKHRQMIRAYEIMISTGKSILYFHDGPKTEFIRDVFFDFNIIIPNRQLLYNRINDRVDWMLENGAIEEVRDLLSRINSANIDSYPVFGAIGAREIAAYLGEILPRNEMIDLIKLKTRHYAKRQITWFKHQVHESEFLKIRLLES